MGNGVAAPRSPAASAPAGDPVPLHFGPSGYFCRRLQGPVVTCGYLCLGTRGPGSRAWPGAVYGRHLATSRNRGGKTTTLRGRRGARRESHVAIPNREKRSSSHFSRCEARGESDRGCMREYMAAIFPPVRVEMAKSRPHDAENTMMRKTRADLTPPPRPVTPGRMPPHKVGERPRHRRRISRRMTGRMADRRAKSAQRRLPTAPVHRPSEPGAPAS